VNERICVLIVPVYARVGRYQQNDGSINIERPNSVVGEAVVILTFMLIDLVCLTVVAVQTAEQSSKPHESLMVLGDRQLVSVRESIGYGKRSDANP
jgi:hypothetical protein